MRRSGSPFDLVNNENKHPAEQGLSLADSKACRRRPKVRPANPLQAGIAGFFEQRSSQRGSGTTQSMVEGFIPPLPKRYTLYPPLLLLPVNVFTTSPKWSELYAGLSQSEKQELYAHITKTFQSQGLGVTHVALNAPIAAELARGTRKSNGEMANVMRSPAGLVPLYGDWGPREMLVRTGDQELAEISEPTTEDLEKAFWVSAVQNGGVVQVWAPLWTMFSRGNVKEKARIVGEGLGRFAGLDDGSMNGLLGQDLRDVSVVDLFIGIGYFAFSYLKRGVGLVWGWEINGWSVEGLRRGCQRNGWRVQVVTVRGDGQLVNEQGREGNEALEELVESLDVPQDSTGAKAATRCVVFHGDNTWSGTTMRTLRDICWRRRGSERWKRVRHVNLGLLPHARNSWQDSVQILDSKLGGWLHVHENVDVRDLQARKVEIVEAIGQLVVADVAKRGQWEISCCHLEEVKTYAPGVMHCVFDIQILPKS